MPLQLQASILISDRESQSGARGALDGAVVLGGLSATLTFSPGADSHGKRERSVASEVVLVPAGEWLAVRESRFQAPIAEGSRMRIQFRDSGSAPLTEALSLGPIGEQRLSFCSTFCVPVQVLGEIETDDRRFSPGSHATLGGRLVFPRGIVARCTFRPTYASSQNGHLLVGSVDTTVVGAGHEMPFAARLSLTPAPARPLKSIAFLDGYGYRFATNRALARQRAKIKGSETA
jgi:hypothetical protein